ncbi:MAG: iron ABC transporter permease [Hydrogenibacillus schlegelii]|uniref:Iron ABC transporter permease n=1 Tax=Hydrogenibacillus schlegelii TaxID=1484 RepID=A0A947G7Z7_HYDSH|nr:iron ABC transporter permease [Hydrogenibacillus schlegelii]MBT9283583.1 iron ABC transporter permease [Hydrogenibacillus schlegelii]
MSRRRIALGYAGFGLFALAAIAAGLWWGAARLDAAPPGTPEGEWIRRIVWELRAPRVLTAFWAGAALGLAGSALQALFQNALAEPYTLGVSSGAAFGAALFFALGGASGLGAGGTALAGAAAALFLVQLLVRLSRRPSAEGLILAGAAANAFFGALVSLLMVFAGEELRAIVYWLFGSVAGRSWPTALGLGGLVAAGFVGLYAERRRLDALLFGETAALAVGVDVVTLRRRVAFLASALAAGVVAAAGVIGFVGLVAPHVVRRFGAPMHRHLLPLAALFGGGWLVAADLIARRALAPRELPLGVVTALIGAPLFAWHLVRREALSGDDRDAR